MAPFTRAGFSLADVGGVDFIAAPDYVHGDQVRAMFVSRNPNVSRPASGTEKLCGSFEVLCRRARWAPEPNALAEPLTGDPYDDWPPTAPVLDSRVVQARTEKMRGDELPGVGSETVRPGRQERADRGGQTDDDPHDAECARHCDGEHRDAHQEREFLPPPPDDYGKGRMAPWGYRSLERVQ